MLNPHERQALLSLQEILQARGEDITPEGKRALMQADEPQDVQEGKECDWPKSKECL